jgi:methyl-accepting chemotaxis protein
MRNLLFPAISLLNSVDSITISTHSLSHMAQELNELVEKFKV